MSVLPDWLLVGFLAKEMVFFAVQHEHASVEIDVTFNGNGGQADVQRYLEANAARAQALLQAAAGERLWTTITFTKPLTAQEVEQLLRDAGVKAASYTQVGWTATGQRMASAIFSRLGKTSEVLWTVSPF
jgi:hypothetical protein